MSTCWNKTASYRPKNSISGECSYKGFLNSHRNETPREKGQSIIEEYQRQSVLTEVS